MKQRERDRYHRTAVMVVALLVVMPTWSDACADVLRTGREPWFQSSTADAQQRARALFTQAVDKHQQLLRGDAMKLYEQALALWDNPDIRWNLALVLEDLGQDVRAHDQLQAVLRWDTALGAERLLAVRERLRVLQSRRLARIDADSTEPGADVKLDGQPWFQGPGHRSELVAPGTHYVASTKPGYFPVTTATLMVAGEHYRVTLRMTADRRIEIRRWATWKPWAGLASGLALAAAGAALDRQAFAHRDAAVDALARGCGAVACRPRHLPDYDRAVVENRIAIGAFVVGGTAITVGLVLAWLNQPHSHHVEVAPSPIEVTPSVSPDRVGVSASLRF
jgi:hypothetical protein